MALAPSLVSYFVTQPTRQVPTASLRIVAAQGDSVGPLTIQIPGLFAGVSSMDAPGAGPGQYAYEQSGITPGATYEATISDASPAHLPSFTVEFTVDPAPPVVRGCSDPLATNYQAGTTDDDGSCVYTPPPPLEPFFAAPLLQSLRFVVRGDGGALGVDSTLFCEQPRPGQQVRPAYYQLVENGDQVRVQVLTSYSAVTATVRRHGGSQVGAPVALVQVLTLEGSAAPLGVVLSEDKPTGLTRLTPAVGLGLPASLLQAARLTLAGAATGTYRIQQALLGTVASPADSVLLNRPWVAVSGIISASWQLTGPGYNVFEADLPVAGLATGYYQVQLRATRAGWPDAVADSEPLSVRAGWPKTLAVDFRNADNCFGAVFSTGFTPRVRVTATCFRQKPGGSSSGYRDSAGQLTVLSATAQRLLSFETYLQPAWMHEKLALACRLDYLAVGGVRCQTDQAYEPADERAYSLSGGRVSLEQVAWLGSGGNGDDAGVSDTVPANALQLHETGYLLLRSFQS
ncbi:hypothetical protein HHL22_20540 [Hymenobacter sp. RP-2-7]|uniref:Uncharacterized protein n=1 Tax=Hymenobacter polaris TaxID=2682546 RepID=A0A7Y0AHS4_9BACT|nr:hypothetical protein [Hymenobacter polaris]NML67596.1 hypothetical protein [Hymenobacter polaris]